MNSSSEITPDVPPIVSGTFANQTGNSLEAYVKHTLDRKGYTEFWDHKEQVFENRDTVGGKQYER